jgi:hypothetical protein
VHAAHHLDSLKEVRAIVITGEGNKAFIAGADIKEMVSQQYSEVQNQPSRKLCLAEWLLLTPVRHHNLIDTPSACHVRDRTMHGSRIISDSASPGRHTTGGSWKGGSSWQLCVSP